MRLQEACDKNTEKLRLLEEEWDSVQQPLLEELTRKERKKAAVSYSRPTPPPFVCLPVSVLVCVF